MYIFGVKLAYYDQVCDIALSGQEICADKEKSSGSESVNWDIIVKSRGEKYGE